VPRMGGFTLLTAQGDYGAKANSSERSRRVA
jgi:hypothetical protein